MQEQAAGIASTAAAATSLRAPAADGRPGACRSNNRHQIAETGLSMLSALAEELSNMDGPRRKELVAATEPEWAQVADAAQALAAAAAGPGSGAAAWALAHGALQALQAWLRLSTDGISPMRVSPGQVGPPAAGCSLCGRGEGGVEP